MGGDAYFLLATFVRTRMLF